ncbi:MAG TPA: anthranilate synthase component I family protein [Candidatus Omnitrophota bacterium]|nr:anthranilate synthase component I [Candidatus Omnitrophota bacterium]HRK62229.1 anthranilate synthase component I family protein [Candidatus Omnitrophota bacterium]
MKFPQLTPWQFYETVYAQYPVSIFLDSVTFRKPNQRYSMIGYDVKAELELSEKDLADISKSRKQIQTFFDKNSGQVFGYFSYEAAGLFDSVCFRSKKSLAYPAVYLVSFKKTARYDHKLCRWIGKETKDQRLKTKDTFKKFRIAKFKSEISKLDFLRKVKRAKQYIEQGDIYQANFSQKFLFDYKGSPLSIYEKLRKINPSPFSSFLKIRDLEIACASPERLVQKRGQFCETRPIAGTCPKGLSEEALKNWRKKLLGSSKERAEHLMLVDLERNDLGRVCDFKSVKVEEFMTLEKYSHVVHLVSSVSGKLRKDKTALDLLGAMFPGGTITGCPKIRCIEIIDELEPSRRGLYTGSLGYFGAGKKMNRDMDLNIVIRTLVFKNGKGSFQVGAGIVHDSVPEKEYLETLAKGEAMMQALAEGTC